MPVNIHSWQWLWLSNKAFEDAGVPVPTNWDEFVAAGPALEKAGKIPLAIGGQSWQTTGTFNVLIPAIAGKDVFLKVYQDHDAEVAAGPGNREGVQGGRRRAQDVGQVNVQDWNQATNLVITGQAGGQIMGDWAQGEFQVAGQVAGKDYTCLPGLGVNQLISTGGDFFYFPKLDDADKTAAQEVLASTMLNASTQVAFNLKKGSVPVRGDVDVSAANDCMKKGLDILAKGNIIPDTNQLNTEDTNNQLNDLFVEFFKTPSMTPEDAQKRFADIIASAD